MSLLAVVIDDAYVNWAIGTGVFLIGAVGSAVALGWKQLKSFLGPKVTAAFAAHTGLVNEMKEQIPIVGATLQKLGDTQEKQCETLEKHGIVLETHTKMLKDLSNGNLGVKP